MNVSKLRRIFRDLASYTEGATTVLIKDTENRTFFVYCLAGSFAKNLEFNQYIQKIRSRKHSFFLMGTLRGLCEDYIVLKFICQFDDAGREAISRALFGRAMGQSTRAQVKFFSANRPYQPVVGQPIAELDRFLRNINSELKVLNRKYSWGSNTMFPTVKYMANTIGEGELYEYLYHATSCLVHFNPKVLFEMGWGPIPGHAKFSTSNFYEYYFQFSLFYGSLLFVKFCQAFSEELALPPDAGPLITELRHVLEAPGRWPELVTFESMNIQPTALDYLRHVAMAMMEQEELFQQEEN